MPSTAILTKKDTRSPQKFERNVLYEWENMDSKITERKRKLEGTRNDIPATQIP